MSIENFKIGDVVKYNRKECGRHGIPYLSSDEIFTVIEIHTKDGCVIVERQPIELRKVKVCPHCKKDKCKIFPFPGYDLIVFPAHCLEKVDDVPPKNDAPDRVVRLVVNTTEPALLSDELTKWIKK